MSNDFVDLLKKLLISEYELTEEKAESLTKDYPAIVVQGIMHNNLIAFLYMIFKPIVSA